MLKNKISKYFIFSIILCMIVSMLAGCSFKKSNAEKHTTMHFETEKVTEKQIDEETTKEKATKQNKENKKNKEKATKNQENNNSAIDKNGIYTSKDDVALYIHTYGTLPKNFITKKDAKALGWNGGSVEDYAPGKCIGGDHFGNYEKKLPKGAKYHECDIDTLGKNSRGAKRIIYSEDGKIYYTDDHYNTFTQLY